MVGGGEQAGKKLPNNITDGKQGGTFKISQIIGLNRLGYQMPANASATVQRQGVRNYFDKGLYQAQETAICFLNSGAAFVNGATSYLSFDLQLSYTEGGAPASQTFNFGQGTAANIIRTISLYTRSGTELERIRQVNLLKIHKDYHDTAYGTHVTQLQIEGHATQITTDGGTGLSPIIRFTIPMRSISGFFKGPGGGQLIPSQLASGLKIQLELESASRAFQCIADRSGAGPAFTYTVANLTLFTDNFTLADSVLRQLNMISAKQGLEYYYCTYDTREASTGSTNQLSIESRKAASRVMNVATLIQDPLVKDDLFQDSFRTKAAPLTAVWQYTFQSRVGSLWFPNQPIETINEAYSQALMTYGRYGTYENPPSLTYTTFIPSDQNYDIADIATYDSGGRFAICCSFERSNVLNLSGVPLNNSRTLTQNITTVSDTDEKSVTQYLKYVRLARAFINNVVLRE